MPSQLAGARKEQRGAAEHAMGFRKGSPFCGVTDPGQAGEGSRPGDQHFCDGFGMGGGGQQPEIELASSWGVRGKCGGAG